MRVLLINGDPKEAGFIPSAIEIVRSRLEAKGVETDLVRLAEVTIRDCKGCFSCLRTGVCPLDDDVERIKEMMLAAEGLVVGSPVRNGSVTASFKRFYERITYPLGFPLLLEDKFTLAISSVGFAGGKSVNRRLLGLQDVFHTRLSSFVFFRLGIPRRKWGDEERRMLEEAADRLVSDIQSRRPRGLVQRASFSVDRWALRRFMFKKSPDTYSHVIARWREKGYWPL